MGKIFYWIKLKMEFFRDDKRIKKLRKSAGGDTYTIIYLKMMLHSLPDEGILYYDGVGEDFAEELALEIEEEPDNVRMTMAFLLSHGLMEKLSECEYRMTALDEMTGRETEAAERMRRCRARKTEITGKTSQCDAIPSQCYAKASHCSENVTTEFKSLEIRDIDIKLLNCLDAAGAETAESDEENQAEGTSGAADANPSNETPPDDSREMPEIYTGVYGNVKLIDWEWKKLVEQFPDDYTERVDRLSRYIQKSGKRYPSHYATIIRWAKEDERRASKSAGKSKTEKKEMHGSFDTDSFFDAAVQRSYAKAK